MIGQMNRNNPFVVQVGELSTQVDKESIRLIRMGFLFLFVELIFLGLHSVGWGMGWNRPWTSGWLTLVTFSWLGYVLFLVLTIPINAHLKEAENIINGDEYKDIYVNNERLLLIIMELSMGKGELESATRLVWFFIGLSIVVHLLSFFL